MITLGQYLADASQRVIDGPVPCALFVADWVVAQGHPDPLAFMRRSPTRFTACYSALELATRGMIAAAVPETDEPRMGDVGVIERADETGQVEQVCAIRSDERWVTLAPNGGFMSGPAEPLRAWRV